jgi:hypothetical protein
MRPRRRVLLAVLGVAAAGGLVLGVDAGWDRLADATQSRADVRPDGSTTDVVLLVEHNRYRQSTATAAQTLWGTCSATVVGELDGAAPRPLGDDRFLLRITPALGRHTEEKFLGCLRDQTLDRVQATVLSVTHARV